VVDSTVGSGFEPPALREFLCSFCVFLLAQLTEGRTRILNGVNLRKWIVTMRAAQAAKENAP
jgi:hypothetical protein